MSSTYSATDRPVVLDFEQNWDDDAMETYLKQESSLKTIDDVVSLCINNETVCCSAHEHRNCST